MSIKINKIPNRQIICDVLVDKAKSDRDVIVLCCDSRGSASLTTFADLFPKQFVEVGIAEQNMVSIAAGLAACGKKPFAVSPACFLSTRSFEQIKVDVAYSGFNVKLIGISGGISYGALGMTHHSTQDIAGISAVPGIRVYLPSDRFQTRCLISALAEDNQSAYVRVGRNPVEDVYTESDCPFIMDRAMVLRNGNDITVIACGEMVKAAQEAGILLAAKGISTRILDMYCVKPIDKEAVLKAAHETKAIITIEEHSIYGGMGSMISQIAADEYPSIRVKNLALPDVPVITGTSSEVFDYYGLNSEGIVKTAEELLNGSKKIHTGN
jgi:transketolase